MTEDNREVQHNVGAKHKQEFMNGREESGLWFHTLFTKAPAGMVVAAADGRIIAWNEAAVGITGYSPDELSHLDIKDLYFNPQDVDDLMERLGSEAHISDHEAILKLKAGTQYHARLAVSLAKHEDQAFLIMAIAGVTEGKEAADLHGEPAQLRTEDAPRESETHYRLLAENVSDVVWTMDMDLTSLLYVSPSIKNLTGFTPGEVKQMSIQDMLRPGDPDKAMALLEREIDNVRSGTFEPVTVELDLKCRDGATVSTESTISMVHDSSGTPLCVLGVTRDISERKRIEDQLRQSAKMQAVGELAGSVAHEFNNMLTGILGYANMLRLTAEPGTTVHESARRIERAAERAADLTRNLLGFAGRGRRCREAVDLHDVTRGVVTLIRQTIDENIQLSCELNQDAPVIAGDSGQIEQALLNLALNARDAMPSGGRLAISTDIVEIDASLKLPEPDVKPGRYTVMTVSDTGTGISREDLGRIFEPFFTTKSRGHRAGMGLATVYGTVKDHGGFIGVESKPGGGTTFKVYLPMERCEDLDQPEPEVDCIPHVGTGRVLVIDDESLVRDVARSMLEACGYDVVTISNGSEAVEYYRHHGDKVDLVLIDMVMPEMSGRECFRAIREINPGVRAVLSTGYGADGEAREIVREGWAGLVLKPFGKSALAKTVREALSEEAAGLH